ncbi:MAG: excinuclease ABC subunit UvrA, partial [Phycisphaerae bacterium]
DYIDERDGGTFTLDVVVDRLTVRSQIGSRLAESIELALRLSGGSVLLCQSKPGGGMFEDHRYSAVLSCPYHPEVVLPDLSPRLFSFNSPHGACPDCTGLGTVLEFDAELIVPDPAKSLADGAVAAWRHGGKRLASVYAATVREFCQHFGVGPDIPFRNIPARLRKVLMDGTTSEDETQFGATFEGVIPNLRRRWQKTESESVKQRLHAFLSESPCRACGGSRLRPEALCVRIAGRHIAEICALNIESARAFFEGLGLDGESKVIAEPLLGELGRRLAFLCDVGVEYLTLDRPSGTLSGGESQRIHLATQIGSGLSGVCYVLDEPTIGLHQRDSQRLTVSLKHLSAMGNTVIVVEHDEAVIRAADHLVDIGPGAGAHGGEIIVTGSLTDLLHCPRSITGRYLSGRFEIPTPQERRPANAQHSVQVIGAVANNLKNIDVRFPLGCFVCVTGVSGSGKSTLVNLVLLRALRRVINGSGPKPGAFGRLSGASLVDKVIEIDQSPIGRTPRSNPATYVGVFDLIRSLYAKTREAKLRGYTAGRFSFNVKGGRCQECQGQGTRQIEMHFLPDVFVTCSACRGTRYNRQTLEVCYRGKSIADVLDMRVEEAVTFFASFAKIKRLLQALMDVGLGYLTLGQSSVTLSGGEAQRIKLAGELGKTPAGQTLYILDEPTSGLHFADVHHLLNVLNRLVSLGHTVLVIEHNLEVIKTADWVIDLGPEGGDGGGHIVVEGTPEQVARQPDSLTGRFLAPKLHGPDAQRTETRDKAPAARRKKAVKRSAG